MMKRLNIPMILGGLACIPATFNQTRRGSILVSIVFISLLVSAASFINYKIKVPSCGKYLSFIIGVLVSEMLLFVYWGARYGYDDGYGIWFSFDIDIIECLAVSLIGCIAIATLSLLNKYIPAHNQ